MVHEFAVTELYSVAWLLSHWKRWFLLWRFLLNCYNFPVNGKKAATAAVVSYVIWWPGNITLEPCFLTSRCLLPWWLRSVLLISFKVEVDCMTEKHRPCVVTHLWVDHFPCEWTAGAAVVLNCLEKAGSLWLRR